jgi:hypothetical protein
MNRTTSIASDSNKAKDEGANEEEEEGKDARYTRMTINDAEENTTTRRGVVS